MPDLASFWVLGRFVAGYFVSPVRMYSPRGSRRISQESPTLRENKGLTSCTRQTRGLSDTTHGVGPWMASPNRGPYAEYTLLLGTRYTGPCWTLDPHFPRTGRQVGMCGVDLSHRGIFGAIAASVWALRGL
ncbi:hypothetical protein PV04_10428 [Phialophora macrospora]|uniref:Uncharacterized protein n=1 Tax=Phialophora macrospora TaxID=1851006 RepID=A0A0D2F2R4_9EURO|nr:hypothetical protein PV04_10428 [Phialophora macrospora]